MKILLTGGAGYIGSHVAAVLAGTGHEIVILDNFCNSRRSVLARLENILGGPLQIIEGDVRDTFLVSNILHDYKIEAVIHLAGIKAAGESVGNPIEYYASNVVGAISLLQAMNSVRVKKLVFSSSATVYGDPLYLPIDEVHPTNPKNPYGHSKLQIERILCDVASSDSEWQISCLRYFNPIGAHESGIIGDEPRGKPNNLVPSIAQVAQGTYPSIQIFGNDYETVDGTCLRDYIHIMDLAEGHLAALNYLNDKKGMCTFNLGTGNAVSVLDVINCFGNVSGRIINYEISGRRDGDIAACYAKVDKALFELKWQSKLTLKDMCESAWKFQKNQ